MYLGFQYATSLVYLLTRQANLSTISIYDEYGYNATSLSLVIYLLGDNLEQHIHNGIRLLRC